MNSTTRTYPRTSGQAFKGADYGQAIWPHEPGGTSKPRTRGFDVLHTSPAAGGAHNPLQSQATVPI